MNYSKKTAKMLRRYMRNVRIGRWPHRLWCGQFGHRWRSDLTDDTAITCDRCEKWGSRSVYVAS